jgi:hypothetical protein
MQGQPVEKSKRVWEKPIQRDETHFAESDKMTYIPATILAVEKQLGRPGRHRVFVRILLRKYRGSFNALKFGENKPLMGVLSKRTTRPYLLPRSQPQSGAVVPVVDDSVKRNFSRLLKLPALTHIMGPDEPQRLFRCASQAFLPSMGNKTGVRH